MLHLSYPIYLPVSLSPCLFFPSYTLLRQCSYQCANQYRKMVKDGEIDDPNYYVDEKGVLRHRSRDAKNGGEGGSELSGRKRTTRAKKPAKKRRKGADADTIFADDVSDGSESEKGTDAQHVHAVMHSLKWCSAFASAALFSSFVTSFARL
mmetsp:Transcript_19273/g.49393  ORF Transcript_19273/g.49393 Transcript_19273/m.49393 type:complete len:151 (-) Transcript_19273:112-564(-)